MNKYKISEQFRCPLCNKLILSYFLRGKAAIAVKCPRCKKLITMVLERTGD